MSQDSQISLEKLKSNLQTQLDELESLQSMFCNPGEIKIDPLIFYDVDEYVKQDTPKESFIVQLDYTINLNIEDEKYEICVNLPHEYPDVTPEIFVRNSNLNRLQHVAINKEIIEYLETLDREDPCIFAALSWLQDNAQTFKEVKEVPDVVQKSKTDKLVRYWIYAHHIYSKTKRKEILEQANNYKLNGFSMPGKPGIICIEGYLSDCEDWWQIIKSMNWKKIFVKFTQENDVGENFHKFEKFEEIAFAQSGGPHSHTNMGEFLKYLESKSLGGAFKELFGIEGKSL